MSRPIGQLDRSLDALTSGLLGGYKRRKDQLAYSALREVEQQLRVPLTGEAWFGWASVDKTVSFLHPFIYAPDQRGVPFERPHFTYGVELQVGSSTLIIIHAQVIGWVESDSSWITGAKVRFAVSAPNSGETIVQFAAVGHLSFQGWAAEFEEGEIA